MKNPRSWLVLVVVLWAAPSWTGEQGADVDSATAAEGKAAHWGYEGDDGPARWGQRSAEGRHNSAYDPIWEHLPRGKDGRESVADLTLDLDDLLPKRRLAFRYGGSLRTPPCSEGVRWFVLAEPVELSTEQIATFEKIYDHNNRPTQRLGGRSLVLEKIE